MSNSNPIDDYIDETVKVAADRENADMQAFETWRGQPSKQNLSVLMRRFEPTFNQRASLSGWRAPAVPEAAFKADLHKNALQAFKTFDPDRGAQLRTHVNNLLKRSQRFNAKYQNMAFIPEEKSSLITPIQQATDFLHQEHDEQPTDVQVARYLSQNEDMLPKRVRGKMTAGLVKTVRDYQIKDIPGEAFDPDPGSSTMSLQRETLDLLRPALVGDEQIVFDYMFGKNGKPKVESTGQIATRMGKSPSQISRLKKRIEATFKKYG